MVGRKPFRDMALMSKLRPDWQFASASLVLMLCGSAAWYAYGIKDIANRSLRQEPTVLLDVTNLGLDGASTRVLLPTADGQIVLAGEGHAIWTRKGAGWAAKVSRSGRVIWSLVGGPLGFDASTERVPPSVGGVDGAIELPGGDVDLCVHATAGGKGGSLTRVTVNAAGKIVGVHDYPATYDGYVGVELATCRLFWNEHFMLAAVSKIPREHSPFSLIYKGYRLLVSDPSGGTLRDLEIKSDVVSGLSQLDLCPQSSDSFLISSSDNIDTEVLSISRNGTILSRFTLRGSGQLIHNTTSGMCNSIFLEKFSGFDFTGSQIVKIGENKRQSVSATGRALDKFAAKKVFSLEDGSLLAAGSAIRHGLFGVLSLKAAAALVSPDLSHERRWESPSSDGIEEVENVEAVGLSGNRLLTVEEVLTTPGSEQTSSGKRRAMLALHAYELRKTGK